MSAPLRLREYRLLFSGQVVSNLGDWLDFIALAVLIAYVWELGPSALAALSVAIAIPWIFVAPFSGVLVDRWPKKRVLIGSDLVRAGIVALFVIAPSLPVLLLLVALKTTVATFFGPADQATIRILVPESQLHAANALSQLVQQSTKVVGPALGGLLVAVTSPRVAFGVDAATFLISAVILSRMRPIDDPRAARGASDRDDEEEGGYWAELREGLAYIRARRALVLCIVGFGSTIFLLFCFDSLSPLAFQQLGVSKALFGLAVAGIGAGGVLGTIAVGRYAGDVNPFVLLGGGTAVVGGCVALVGTALVTDLGLPPWLWTPVLMVVGIASAGILVASPTIIQKETPPELMGRVSTSASSIPTGLQMFAPIAGAALAEWQSVGFVFTLSGGALAVLGAGVLLARVPVGVGVELEAVAEVVLAASPAAAPERDPGAGSPLQSASSGSDEEVAATPAVLVGATKGNGRASFARSHYDKEAHMSDLDILKSAGFNLDELSADQVAAVETLSRDELETLAAIRGKLNGGEDEVAGHARAVAGDGNFVW
jgi:predicted MFS family arabinose efflux permease